MRHLAVILVLLLHAQALAQVTLPNGLVVPTDSVNGEVQLYSFFDSRGEAIDWVADARAVPDAFSPLCAFTATLLLKESASSLGVGWYNVDPAATSAPPASEIYEILPAGSAPGATISGTSIRMDPRYRGGLVGFALIRTPPHYTERRWNTVCSAGPCASTPGPWVLSLSYPSSLIDNAWYVAFEDGDTSSSSWNNDGDYNDYVFLFTGVSCPGAGEACTVDGALGICAPGLLECGVGGALTCRPVNTMRDERCDGNDEDCDGRIDEGDSLCAGMDVCFRGRCVPPCFEGGCGSGEVCSDGICVEESCLTVTCDAGEVCRGGTCADACDGVVCPGAQVCRVGRCVDACAGVVCDVGRVCEGGVCVEDCDCRGCGDGLVCAPTGSCIDAACEGLTCVVAGQLCRDGECVDPCDGAVCPEGQVCSSGACVDDPGPGDTDAGAGADGGGGTGGMDAGPREDAGATSAMDGGGGATASGGCGCRSGGSSRPTALLGLLTALIVVGVRRRR